MDEFAVMDPWTGRCRKERRGNPCLCEQRIPLAMTKEGPPLEI